MRLFSRSEDMAEEITSASTSQVSSSSDATPSTSHVGTQEAPFTSKDSSRVLDGALEGQRSAQDNPADTTTSDFYNMSRTSSGHQYHFRRDVTTNAAEVHLAFKKNYAAIGQYMFEPREGQHTVVAQGGAAVSLPLVSSISGDDAILSTSRADMAEAWAISQDHARIPDGTSARNFAGICNLQGEAYGFPPQFQIHHATDGANNPRLHQDCHQPLAQDGDLYNWRRPGEKHGACKKRQQSFTPMCYRSLLGMESTVEHVCAFCSKSFKHKPELFAHLRVHNHANRYFCTICERYFSRSHTFSQHLRTHKGVVPYNPTECDSYCVEKGALGRHGQLEQCCICDASFEDNVALTEHLVTHCPE
ncbi:zinc finger protein 615-like isoform X2 [Dermacentor silvarum]|uniref:zinc finger protein 615-like isoform X2 n=1 Tax=Dermacentor silvarum TaxID=543639 RepID=UPI00210120A6|nr:zinc finger protein 615-like isoform X2 [Dermacentor silvarum]